jgi:hypothetical protein
VTHDEQRLAAYSCGGSFGIVVALGADGAPNSLLALAFDSRDRDARYSVLIQKTGQYVGINLLGTSARTA